VAPTKNRQATNPNYKNNSKTQNQHHRALIRPLRFCLESRLGLFESWGHRTTNAKDHKDAPNEPHGGPNFDNQTARGTETRRPSMPLTFIVEVEITTSFTIIVRKCVRTLSSIGSGGDPPRQPVRVGVFEVESAVAGTRSSTRPGRPGIRTTKCADPLWVRHQAWVASVARPKDEDLPNGGHLHLRDERANSVESIF
jgi:hypothetical protein